MVIKIGLFTVAFNDWPLEKVLQYASKLGYEAVELAAWKGSNHLNLEKVLSGGAGEVKGLVEKYGMIISALSNHLEAQLVLGPLDESTDEWFKGTPEEKVKYGMQRVKQTAEAAAQLDVPVV
ncbi:MAG: sugar phosphate isomerase/epimerase, partial [Thermoprotei archaeon]